MEDLLMPEQLNVPMETNPSYGGQDLFNISGGTTLNTSDLINQFIMNSGSRLNQGTMNGIGSTASVDPIQLQLDAFGKKPTSSDYISAPLQFDLEKSGAARYMSSNMYGQLGFDPRLPQDDTEFRYGSLQDWGDTMSQAFAGGAQLFVDTFEEGWKGWGRMTEALFTWDASKLMGSPEEREEIARRQEEVFNKYAIYDTAESRDSIFNRQFFGNMLQQSGFMFGAAAQMLLENYVTMGLGSLFTAGVKGGSIMKLMKTALTKGELANETRKVANTMTLSEKVIKGISDIPRAVIPLYGTVEDIMKVRGAGASLAQMGMLGVGGIKREISLFNMARSEAIFESASTYADLRKKLTDEYTFNTGEAPSPDVQARIDQKAEDASHDNFWTNVGVLSVMNRIQFDNVIRSFNPSRNFFTDNAAEFAEETVKVTGKIGGKTVTQGFVKGPLGGISTLPGIAKTFGMKKAAWEATKMGAKGLMKFEGSEGIQELLQEASSKGLNDYYYDLYHGREGFGSKTEAVLSSIQNPFTDTDGMKTFLMGALTGRMMAPITSAVTMLTDREAKSKRRAQAKDDLKIVNDFLKDPTNNIYAKEWIANTKVQNHAAKTMSEAAANGDKYVFYNAKNSAFAKAVASAIKLDMYESLRDTLLEMGDGLNDEQFKEAFNMDLTKENKGTVKQFMGEIVSKVENYHTVYHNLKAKYADKIIPELYKNSDPKEYAMAILAKKVLDDSIEVLTTNTVLAQTAVTRASSLQQEMASNKTIGASTSEIVSRLGSEELIDAEIEILEESIAQATAPDVVLTDEQKKLLEEKKEELQKVKRFKEVMLDVLDAEDQSEFPGTESRFYESFKEIVGFYNTRSKINTPINDEDVSDAFISFFDYMRLNKDHKSYIDAMNFLAAPTNLKIYINAQKSARIFINQQYANEHAGEIQGAAGGEIKQEGRKIVVQLKDKNGNPVDVELEEGQEYITEAFPETRVYPKQKTRTTNYRQDVIKVTRIEGDNISITINDEGESITYSKEEFQEYLGKLFPLSKMTNDERIYFKNRNKIIKLNVRAKTGKRHLIYGKHKDLDYRDNGVDVDARLELQRVKIFANEEMPEPVFDSELNDYIYDNTPKEDKYENVLMVHYTNPVTGMKETFRYDQNYMDKYVTSKYGILDVTVSEAEYMRTEDQNRRNVQVGILNTAIDDTIKKLDEQLDQRKALKTAQEKLQNDLDDLIAEMELLEDFLQKNKSKRSKSISQLKKENKERLLIVNQLINTTRDTIEKNREALLNIEQQLDVLERALEYYEAGLNMLRQSEKPFSLSSEGVIYQEELEDARQLEQEYTMNPERRDPTSSKFISDQQLTQLISDTQTEIEIITENISELETMLERLNTLLGKILAFEDIYEMLSNVTDRDQLRNQIVMMERQIAGDIEEVDNYKLLAKSQLLQALRKGLAKGDTAIEFQYTLELIEQMKETSSKLKSYQNQLSLLQPKLDRLTKEEETRVKSSLLQERIAVLKFIQEELVKQFKIRQAKAGIKVEDKKVIVSPSGSITEAREDELIKGPESILITQVVEDLVPEGEQEKDSYITVMGSVPVLNETALFKSANRHFEDLNDTVLESPESARFFKFSETVNLREKQVDGGGVIYYFMPVTKDSKDFQELRVTQLSDGTTFDDDIRLVVVRKDAFGNFKPVDINGNILENPTKDNMVYAAMSGHSDLLSGDKEKMVDWVNINFVNKNETYTKDEIYQIATNFVAVREEIKKRVAEGQSVLLPIEEKSPGVFNREPKVATEDGRIAPQELPLNGRLIEDNPDFKNLKHPDGSSVRLTVSTVQSRVRPGRLLMVKNEDPATAILVYNRKFTEQEHNNIIEVLKRMTDLFNLKQVGALDEESDQEFQNGIRYLQGVIHWFRPADGKSPYPFQMWVDNGLHIGDQVIEFNRDTIEANRKKIIEAIPYHKINNSLLTNKKYDGQSFPEVRVVDDKIVVGKKYFNYQEYLLTEREGGPVVYTNIKPYKAPTNDLTPDDFQLKNVYLRYSVDHIMELPMLTKKEESTPDDKAEAKEKKEEGDVKKYGISLSYQTGPDKKQYTSLTNDIPKSGRVTFVGLRFDGITKLYIHTEYKDGKYVIFNIIDENGVDATDAGQKFIDVVGSKYDEAINKDIFEDFLDLSEVKLFPSSETLEATLKERLNIINKTFVSIEEYSGKGEKPTVKTEDAKRPVPVTPVQPVQKTVDEGYENFVDEKYDLYLADPNNVGQDMLDRDSFESVFQSNLKAAYRKFKEGKPTPVPTKTVEAGNIFEEVLEAHYGSVIYQSSKFTEQVGLRTPDIYDTDFVKVLKQIAKDKGLDTIRTTALLDRIVATIFENRIINNKTGIQELIDYINKNFKLNIKLDSSAYETLSKETEKSENNFGIKVFGNKSLSDTEILQKFKDNTLLSNRWVQETTNIINSIMSQIDPTIPKLEVRKATKYNTESITNYDKKEVFNNLVANLKFKNKGSHERVMAVLNKYGISFDDYIRDIEGYYKGTKTLDIKTASVPTNAKVIGVDYIIENKELSVDHPKGETATPIIDYKSASKESYEGTKVKVLKTTTDTVEAEVTYPDGEKFTETFDRSDFENKVFKLGSLKGVPTDARADVEKVKPSVSSSAVDDILKDALGKDDDDTPFDPNARVENPENAGKARENILEFKKWMSEVLPIFPVEVFDELIDGKYGGQFYKGIVNLSRNAESGTGFHEAFEAVWNALLTNDRKRAIIEEYKNRPNYVNDKYFVWARDNYKTLNEDGWIKEALAEEFREYMLSGAANVVANSPKRNTFFRKLWNLILKLLGLSDESKRKMDSKIEELFSEISGGKFKDAPVVTSYDPYIKHNKAISGLSVEFTELLMEGMSAMFFMKLYSDNSNINDLFSTKNNIFEVIYADILSALAKEFRPGYKAMVSGENFQKADEVTRQAATDAYDERQRQLQGAELYDQKLKSILMYNGPVREHFKKYLSQFGLSFKQVEANEDEIIEQIEEKEESANNYGIKDVIYVDPTNLTNPTVRLLIMSLPEDEQDIDGKIKSIEKNAIGLYSLVPYKKKMNILLNELSNIVPVHRKQKDGTYKYVSALEQMHEKLNKKFKDPTHPARYKKGYTWINRLFKRLKYDKLVEGTALTDDELRLILAFENSFNRNRNIPVKVMIGVDGRIRDVNAISVSTKQKIKEEWRNSVTDKQLKSEVSGEDPGKQDILVINTASFIEINLKSNELKRMMSSSTSLQEKMRTLARLGIKLSKPSATFSNEETDIINTSFNALKHVFDDYEKRNERFFYSQLFDRRTVSGPLNRLLEIEAEFRSEEMLLSHLTPENKMQYAITLPSEISNILSSLNAVESLDEFVMTNPQYGMVNQDGSVTLHPYNSTSEILKPGGLIFNTDGKKYKNTKGQNQKNIEYIYVQGMASDQVDEGNNTDKLEYNDKIVQEMYHILMHGTYYSVINSDKSSEFGIKMGHLIPTQEILNNNLIEEKYLNALRAELLHAFQFHFFPNNIKDHQNRILQLGHFQGILNFSSEPGKESPLQKVFLGLVNGMKITSKTSKKTAEQLFNLAADNFISEVKNQGAIKKYVDAQVEEHKKWLISKKIIQFNDATQRFETLSIPEENPLLGVEVKNMSSNDMNKLVKFIVVNRQLAIYEQHKLFYGHPALYKDLPKRSSGANSQKNVASENSHVINNMNITKPRYDGVQRNPDRPVVRVQTYDDPVVVSKNLEFIAEQLYHGFMKAMGNHQRVSELIGAEFYVKTGKVKKLNIEKRSLLNAYVNLTEADGQAYIMPDYFRDLMYLSSLLSKEQEDLLDYENALEIVERSEADPGSIIHKTYPQDVIDAARELLKQEKPDAILQTLKPQGFGFAITEKMSHMNLLKNSVFPLTWSRVKNHPTMLAKYIDAQNSGTDIISFASGHKVGIVTDNKGKIPGIYGSNGEVSRESPKPLEILSRFIGIQVQTDDYAKDRVIFGSQIRKIILGNLPDELKEKRDYYISIIDELIDIERNKLMDELGLKLVDGVYKAVDLDKLVSTLKEQAIRRNLPDNIVDMLDVVKFDLTEQLRHPLDANPARERIEYVLTALVDSRLVRMEMFGKSAIQVSSTMFESGGKRDLVYLKNGIYQKVDDFDALSTQEKKSVRLASNDLKFYDGDNSFMEVYVPWMFEGITPQQAGFTMTSDGYWVSGNNAKTENLLKAIGFRIPSQGFNSVDSIRIKGFLDPSMGDVVVVPTEIVGKSGSDYDIDKLNMFLKNYTFYEGQLDVVQFTSSEDDLEQRYIEKVRERQSQDVRELLLTLSLEERNEIREEFKEKKKEIIDQLDGKYKANKLSLKESLEETYSSVSENAANADDYFKKLFKVDGPKIYRMLDSDLKEYYKTIKNDIAKRGIQGPREIEMYLENTIMLKESGLYAESNPIFESLIVLYQEELRILGYKQYLKEYVEKLRDIYQKQRGQLAEEKKKNGRLKIAEASEFKNEELKKVYLDMAKQSAKLLGYYTLEEFGKLPAVKQNSKKALQNELVDVMIEIVEHPENRRQLLVPNSVNTLKSLSEYIIGLRGSKSYVETDMTKLSEWKTMSDTRETFVTSKQLVGSGAQHVTAHAMAQVGEVELTGYYITNEGTKKTVNIKLTHDKTNKLDLTLDANQMYIFDLISEVISGSVDASKDPFIYELRLNLETAPTWLYLTKRGVPQNEITLLMNQPIVDLYYANKASNNTFVNKTNDTKLTYNEVILETIKPFYEKAFGKPLVLDESQPINKLIANIRNSIQNIYSAHPVTALESSIRNQNKLTSEEAKRQIAILFDTLDYAEQGGMLFNFIRSIGYDTTRTKTIMEYRMQQYRYKKVFMDQFVTEDSVHRVFDRTFLKKIKDEKENMLSLFSEFFVSLHPNVVSAFDPVIKQIENPRIFMSETDKIELLKRYQSYLIAYILQNTPYGKESAIKESFDMFMDQPGKPSFPKTLKKLKERYPDNMALKSLFPIINDNRLSTDNIKLFNTAMSSYEINVLSTGLENLMELAKRENDVELDDFVNNLARFTILQSGIQNSPITFTKVMPISLYSDIVSKILRTFISESEGLDVNQVWKTFHQNYYKNSLVVPKVKWKKRNLQNGLFIQRQGSLAGGFDYVKTYEVRKGVTDQMLKEGHLSFEEKFKVTLYEKIKIFKNGFDITDTLSYVRFRPINLLGNGMYFLETTPADITGRSRLEMNNSFDEGDFDESVSNYISNAAMAGDTDTPNFDRLPEYNSDVSTKTYAGIGSRGEKNKDGRREIPQEIRDRFIKAIKKLNDLDYIARTGDAAGSDGVVRTYGKIGNVEVFTKEDATDLTREIAREIHPNPDALSNDGLDLMARNTKQIFGESLDSPVDFVLVYEPSGYEGAGQRPERGGSNQAIDMAYRKGIPVINLALDNWENKFNDLLQELSKRPVVKSVRKKAKPKETKSTQVATSQTSTVAPSAIQSTPTKSIEDIVKNAVIDILQKLGVDSRSMPQTTPAKNINLMGSVVMSIIDDWVKEGKATSTVRNPEYHKTFYKGDGVYRTDNGSLVEVKHKGLVKLENNRIYGSEVNLSKEEFAQKEGYGTWMNFIEKSKYAGKSLLKGYEVHYYEVKYVGDAGPMFKDLKEFTPKEKERILNNFALKHKMSKMFAENYINDALVLRDRNFVISKLKECY